MSSPTVTRVSEWFVKPLDQLAPNPPIHFTPWELGLLNVNYSQKGLLFPKPPHPFSIAAFLDELRRSLSATLTHFHPLAARLATRHHQNPPSYLIYLDPANSPGAKFIYATADATVSHILKPPADQPPLVHSLFDLNEANSHDGHTLPLLSIQVTELVDGIFIGGSVNHMVADGTSFWHFMAAWSELFRSKGLDISRPPVRTPWVTHGSDPLISLPYSDPDQFIERFECPPFQERFFHFSTLSLSKLKAKANAECNNNAADDKISSLQAVAALMWRCVTRLRRLPHEQETDCRLVVNNRRRLSPPLPDEYLGNPVQTVRGVATVGDLLANGLGWAALRIHEAVRKHDDKAVREWGESWVREPAILPVSRLLDPRGIHIGSSPRFDMYGCEFGLGKAVAARSGLTNKGEGKLTMFPGRDGGGSIDLEVCLSPEQMEDLESDEELICALSNN